MEEETQRHIKRLHIYILLLTLAVFALLWFFVAQQRQLGKAPSEVAKEEKIKRENRGALTLQTRDNLRSYAVGQPVVLQVLADSDKEDIVGFDVLLSYSNLDQEPFNLGAVTTPLTGFRVIDKVQRGHLSVTGIQDPQNSTRQLLKETVILEVTLVPTLAGEHKVSIVRKADPETTKMVTAQTEVLYPEVQDLTISVK